MSIANELSSDVATAVLARKANEATEGQRELADVVMQAHSTLRHLMEESRKIERNAYIKPGAHKDKQSAATNG